MRSRKGWVMLPLLSSLSLAVAACGGGRGGGGAGTGTGAEPAETKPKEPVTLNFLYNGYSKELLGELQAKVEQKLPGVKLNMILEGGQGNTIEDIVAKGTELDLVGFPIGGIFKVIDLRLATDLLPLAQKHKFDLNRLSPGVLDSAKSYSDKGELLMMPYELNVNVLIYNKNLFNKFGVPYPKDGMTWDDVFELAKKLTRQEGGVKYRGFQYNAINMVYKNQLALPFVDPKTMKAAVNTDEWKKWLEVMSGFYHIVGNEPEGYEHDNFLNKQIVAMRTGPSLLDMLPAA
ncbi:ABC transporter substrate-binding protein, partial [Paenibacillus sp. GYB003]|uniref:ABC transporter substrate-binding protein n=1 Tax=Paenibacillus sp. GYB003 TaxID=2994392 RepID=UPI002F969B9F